MQQSQSITPSQLTQVTQGSAQVAFKPGVPGADIQPDLSHLTPEERRIIEDVINRQRQEELIDRSQGNLPPPVVVQRGSKVFQRLPTLPDTLLASSGSAGAAVSSTNAQAANSLGRAKDEFFGGVTRRGRFSTDRPFPSVHHNRTSGDLFGAVSSFFTRTGGTGAAGTSSGGGGDSDVCEICHVTKFTSTAGHNCAQCNLKTCVRCGGWFGTQPSWMCKNCFSNLSAPPKSVAGGVKDVQRSTAARSLATTDQSATTSEILPHSRHNPVSSAASTSSTRPHPVPPTSSSSSSAIGNVSNVPPSVERSQCGYAGIASRSKLREAMRDHRSVSEEERVWSQYQPTPSSHTHPLSQQHGRQPPANCYSSHSHPHHQTMRQQSYSTAGVSTKMAPRYLQQHSSHYPPSITYNQLPPPPQFRHSTGPPLGGRANRREFGEEGSWTHPSFPPPLRMERHAFRPSDGGGGGTSATSCGSAEGSPRTGFQAAYLQRSVGGGQMDPGSVSEPCQSEAFLRGDHHKSLTAEGRMYQHSFDVDRPVSSRSVFWSPSQDGESLVGQVYLRKSRASGEIGLLSSFGLKLVIGKRVPSDMVGTFVSSVKEGSVADLMGELQTGDEILEWNGHNLRGLHQEEVSEILALSRNTDEVWLTVQRVLDDFYEESDGATSTSFSRHDEDTRFQDEEGEEYGYAVGRRDADPHLQLKLRYDEGKQELVVSILAARDLPPQLNTQTWLCNSFCQITILPETSKYESRCTRVARNTNDPVWIHNFTFDNFVLSGKELEVAVIDYRQGRTALIGEVLINLQVADISGRAYWYPIPPPWDATDQDISSQVQSESGTFEPDDWSGEASERGMGHGQQRLAGGSDGRSLRNISPHSVPSQLSSAVRHRRQQMECEPRTTRRGTRASAQPAPPRTHPTDRGPRFTLSEDDQSFLSDNSEASEFSSFSKLSLQSNRLRQRQSQRLNTGSTKLGPTGGARHLSPRMSRSRPDCRSPPQDLLAETGEEEGEDDQGGGIEAVRTDLDGGRRKSDKGREERSTLDDQPKSSSTEEKSASSSTPAGMSARIASSASSAPATDIGSSAGAPKSPTASSQSAITRKRRSSISHRFSNVLGISKKNTTASGADKKTKASFQRSEEVLPAYIQTNEKATVSGGYKAPGIVAEGAGFGGIAASSAQSAGGILGAQGGHLGTGLQHQLSTTLYSSGGPGRKDLALEMGEMHVGEFVEGLGPGQLVGRQVLGMPCLGEIQLSFFDRKGHLEVEVIRARGLQQKNTSKPLPTPYVKLHLLEGKQSVEKMRTAAPARRTLDPLFQQQFSFSNSYKDKILQVSVWGEYGRMDKKVFLGMCEIVLDDLNLRSIVFGWYKLFGMIAATAQHHKQVRRHTSSSGGRTSSNPSSSSAAAKRRASKSRQPRDKS